MLRTEETRREERDKRRQASTNMPEVSTFKPKSVKVNQQAADQTGRLKHQVANLKNQLATLQANAEKAPLVSPSHAPRIARRQPLFCYKCGEDGHGMRGCDNQVNATLVQKKLTERVRKSENAREPPRRDDRGAQKR
jgi:hypothetical protein